MSHQIKKSELYRGRMTILELSSRERTSLEILAVQTNSAKELRRAQALIWLVDGESVEEVAERL
jgi:hypothetical protein